MTASRNHSNDCRRAARLVNLRRLAEELQQRPMGIFEIAALLGLSRTESREYIADLGRLVDVTRRANTKGGHIYQITASAKRVDAYLAKLVGSREPNKSVAVAKREGRCFHILADDEPFSVKVGSLQIPAAWAVHAAFWAGREVRA